MGDLAIRVVGLGKQYHIGALRKTHDRFGEQLVDLAKAPFRRAGKLLRGQAGGVAELDETIWALKDVSFEVNHGEVVGIIGRNGAGKSTLLKILSRITEPTEGSADLYGRVGSLLEVGTGFHPELTGRENVYLNGAILGMKRGEIERKFDEIVAFAEVDKFIDTPVKHYSSGMYVRMAFSIAAHLEPEILLVDEVLAVGDVAFQRKCLGKMDDIAKEGRTVLFVSHNMAILQTLCERGILLQDGVICVDSRAAETVGAYLQTLEQMQSRNLAERTDRRGEGKVKLVGVEVTNGRNKASSILKAGEPARFEFYVNSTVPGLACAFNLVDQLGQPVTGFISDIRGPEDTQNEEDGLKFTCEVDELLLLPGRYRVDVWVSGDDALQDAMEAAGYFDVQEGFIRGRPTYPHKRLRAAMPHRWTKPAKD
jgi:lipopolysaccharide transport system ATP-binding protein